MSQLWDVIIIGAGASGLAAAARLAQSGRPLRTLVLEQADRPGKKLLATGNGRCNLYQTQLLPHNFTSIRSADCSAHLSAVIAANQLDFWHSLGLMTLQQQDGRIYPLSQQSAAVVNCLRLVAEQGGVQLLFRQRVRLITHTHHGFAVYTRQEQPCLARYVILATGGLAGAAADATGDGYPLAGQLGHSCTDVQPGLVPIRCVNPAKTLSGVRNASTVTLYHGDQVVAASTGEVQFTEYGVSGIVMMDLSNHMRPGIPYTLVLDLLPDYDHQTLLDILQQKVRSHPGQKAEFLLLGILKHQLGAAILRASRVDIKRRTLDSLTTRELETIVQRIKTWTLRTEGTLSWQHAQVTQGGIPLDQVEPQTFQSRKTPGLYITGELLDVAGDCGGYNLSWAFGSGILAARSILSEVDS